jgi:LPS export ABC transporter protein LptC
MILGIGLLGAFFIVSGGVIYVHNAARIPPSQGSLDKESIEGGAAPGLATPGAASVGFVLNDFHRSSIKDGKVEWEIFGKRGRYDALHNTADVEEPRLNLTRTDGETVTLRAGRALLNMTATDLNKAELFDNVVVVHKGETTLTADYAIYRKDQDTVEIPDKVTIDGPIFSITGKRMIAKIEPQDFVITNGVKSTFKPRKKK